MAILNFNRLSLELTENLEMSQNAIFRPKAEFSVESENPTHPRTTTHQTFFAPTAAIMLTC